jgi:hypothetical protein
MRKIGGLVLLSALVLVGCSAPGGDSGIEQGKAAGTAPEVVTKDGQQFDVANVKFNSDAVPAFKDAVSTIPAYASLSQDSLATIGRDLCEHYAGGFTTEDLRASSVTGNGDALASLGETAKATVCATP